MATPGSRIVGTIERPAPDTTDLVDVERVLQAQYLAAVVEQLRQRRVPVDGAVLNGPGRPGGIVVLGDGGPAAEPDRPSCARWDGGRSWTLVSIAPGSRSGVSRRRLRMRRLPAPDDVAAFVAQAASGRRPGPDWSPTTRSHLASRRRAPGTDRRRPSTTPLPRRVDTAKIPISKE